MAALAFPGGSVALDGLPEHASGLTTILGRARPITHVRSTKVPRAEVTEIGQAWVPNIWGHEQRITYIEVTCNGRVISGGWVEQTTTGRVAHLDSPAALKCEWVREDVMDALDVRRVES